MNAPASTLPLALSTPLHIGAVGLKVRDLDRLDAFYRDTLGLLEIARSDASVILGAGGTGFLYLEHDPTALPDDRHTAGLFHTAFLMPSRADLAHWVARAARSRLPITGAADHGVSEAIYLDDPEGNGIEVYADRDPATWRRNDGLVDMTTERLDLDALLAMPDAQAPYEAAPDALRIGHVHLRVGDVARAESFYRDALGLDRVGAYRGAAFLSSGGYHHHIATNVWQSSGAGARDDRRAGLAWLAFEASDVATRDATLARLEAAGVPVTPENDAMAVRDPWGTRIRLR